MFESSPTAKPRVVIVGGGFAGLHAAQGLRFADVQVTLVDRRNYHLFQPLLYQVATAALDPSDIAAPIRTILRRSQNTDVVLAEVTGIDRAARKVLLSDGELPYDHLILATGAKDSYFGHEDWPGYAPGLKSIEDALEIRRRVLFAFEQAEREPDPVRKKQWLTFVLIGGGPTGVELAGALSEIAHKSIARDFRHVDTHDTRILLVEGQSKILPFYSDGLARRARQFLERAGVEVRTGVRVTGIDADGVMLGDEHVEARTVLWSAGVTASPLAKDLGVPLEKGGRVRVTPALTLPGDDRVYVVGDLAHVEQDGKVIPGVASPAMQMGDTAARNVRNAVAGKPLQPFRYWDRGTFAVVGRGLAVGVLFDRVEMSGFLGWLTWLGVHLFFLIGFRNRIAVMFTWAYSYLTFRRIARLITGAPRTLPAAVKTTHVMESAGERASPPGPLPGPVHGAGVSAPGPIGG